MADSRGLLTNLPVPVSSFIGRETEVRALVGGSRLVTLTGTGGAGKTRLGLQVAAVLADGTGNGVWFADLAPLGDPDLVAVTVAGVMGVRLEPGRPVLDTVAEAVGGQRLLVLLDNCEHLIGACAKLADVLMRGCPNLSRCWPMPTSPNLAWPAVDDAPETLVFGATPLACPAP